MSQHVYPIIKETVSDFDITVSDVVCAAMTKADAQRIADERNALRTPEESTGEYCSHEFVVGKRIRIIDAGDDILEHLSLGERAQIAWVKRREHWDVLQKMRWEGGNGSDPEKLYRATLEAIKEDFIFHTVRGMVFKPFPISEGIVDHMVDEIFGGCSFFDGAGGICKKDHPQHNVWVEFEDWLSENELYADVRHKTVEAGKASTSCWHVDIIPLQRAK